MKLFEQFFRADWRATHVVLKVDRVPVGTVLATPDLNDIEQLLLQIACLPASRDAQSHAGLQVEVAHYPGCLMGHRL